MAKGLKLCGTGRKQAAKATTAAATLLLRVPVPPSVNHYWCTGQGGCKYLSKQARKYRKQVIRLCHDPMRSPLAGRIEVLLTYSFPDKRERDLDNYQKGLFDALQHANVFYKDSQIDKFTVCRAASESPGYCDVEIRELATA